MFTRVSFLLISSVNVQLNEKALIDLRDSDGGGIRTEGGSLGESGKRRGKSQI